MIIYPAIDLRDGKCVRLFKGDFATTKIYHESPAAMLESFAAAGSEWVHLVDLDGAKAGKFTQGALIRELVANSRLKIEVGGGIRETADLEQLFASGVARVVIGSVCVSNPALVRQWLEQFGAERIVLALDCSLAADGTPKVLTHGWQQESSHSVSEVLANYPQAKYVLCTDISVDGTLSGPSIALYQHLQKLHPQLELIASGGVGALADVVALKPLQLNGVVIGKALYENKFTLEAALAV